MLRILRGVQSAGLWWACATQQLGTVEGGQVEYCFAAGHGPAGLVGCQGWELVRGGPEAAAGVGPGAWTGAAAAGSQTGVEQALAVAAVAQAGDPGVENRLFGETMGGGSG